MVSSLSNEGSQFLFVSCQVGAEPALKREIARDYPDFHFAFSRPGFVTFKSAKVLEASFELHSVFARAYGLSYGKLEKADGASVLGKVREMTERSAPFQLQVWERDRHAPGEEPLGFVRDALETAALSKILDADTDGLFSRKLDVRTGDLVIDVIVIEQDEWWIGMHSHTSDHAPQPGAKPGLILPSDAPSRAWLKLEESLLVSGADVRPGDVAVELGSAPGGATFALLNRGLHVVGVDPGEMHPSVMENPNFMHMKCTAAELMRRDLPDNIQWFLNDMNVEPRISMFAVDKLASRMKFSLLGVLLTIKLNKWSMADEIPGWLEHLRAMGMVHVRATQLFHNRQEVFIFGLTKKGTQRCSAPF